MKTFMLTVESIEQDQTGLHIRPGIPVADFSERPTLDTMIQGCHLELRRPSGSTLLTQLVTYGIGVMRAPNGDLYFDGLPSEQPILLTLPAELSAHDVSPGTEIWLVGDDPAPPRN